MEIKNTKINIKKQYPKINELGSIKTHVLAKLGTFLFIAKIIFTNKTFAKYGIVINSSSNLSPSDLGGLTADIQHTKSYTIPLIFQIISVIIFFISIIYMKVRKDYSKPRMKKIFKILLILSIILFLFSSFIMIYIYFS